MKLLSNHNEETTIGTLELDFGTQIDFAKIKINEDTLMIPLQMSKSQINDIAAAADEVGAEAGYPYLDHEKTEAWILINTIFSNFMCDFGGSIFPRILSKEEQQEQIDCLCKNDEEAKNAHFQIFAEAEKFYKNNSEGVFAFFNIELEPEEKESLLYNLMRFLFNMAYFSEPAKAIPVSA